MAKKVAEKVKKADVETREGQIPLAVEGLGSLAYWQGEITAAGDQVKHLLPEWRTNVARYQNKPWKEKPVKDTVWVPKDFALTERKRPQLWFQLPELFCQPKPGQDPKALSAAPVFAAVVNAYLGDEDQFDADTAMTESVFDAICATGLLTTAIYYEQFVDGTKPVEISPAQPEQVDPATGQILVPAAEAVIAQVPNVLKDQYRWAHFSAAQLLMPADWTGSDYDRAPWLGRRFEKDREEAKQLWKLTDDDLPEAGEPLETLNELEEKHSAKKNRRVIQGTEIWYYAAKFDPSVKHPDRMRWLVLLDKGTTPIIHIDSPCQTVNPDGTLSADSLIGNPIHVGSVRTISDGKFPPSDCQVTRPQVDELSLGRTQMVQQRNRSIPMRAGDKSRIDPDIQAALKAGTYQEIMLVDGPPQDILAEVVRAQFPRENFGFNDQIEQDLDECWAMGPNQMAGEVPGQTATEASIKQRNTDARLAAEQARVKKYFLRGVQKCATLIQRFADAPDYVQIVGQQGEQMLQQWDKTTIAGKYLWTMKPDSQLRTDMSQERQYRTQVYNQLRRDSLVNPQELVKWVLEGFGMTGPQFLSPPAEPQEPPPQISVSVKGEDLNPMALQYSNIVQLLTQDGKPPTFQGPTTITEGAPHGGPQPQAEPLNKHLAAMSGNMPGPSGEANTGGV